MGLGGERIKVQNTIERYVLVFEVSKTSHGYGLHKDTCRHMLDLLLQAPGTSQTQEEIVAELRLIRADRMAVNGCDTCDSLDDVRAIRRVLAEEA
jgi:hypothetical protein